MPREFSLMECLASSLVDFLEYPGKQDFLQSEDWWHSCRNLRETWSESYNLRRIVSHFRTPQLRFELLGYMTGRRSRNVSLLNLQNWASIGGSSL